jgi:hypothetical protein
MIKVALFALGLACVCAEGFATANGTDAGATNPLFAVTAAVSAQVMGERFMSRQYLDVMLRLQHAQHYSIAGSNFAQAHLKLAEAKGNGASFEEDDDADFEESFLETASHQRKAHGKNLEEFVALPFISASAPQPQQPTQQTPGEQNLLAAYHLFYGIKLELLRTIYQAADLQESFWALRAFQLTATSAGNLLPQQTQLLYLLSYKTQLETLKLAYKLQTISHFTMWLEDEIDLDEPANLIQDKEYAFNAYNTFAMLDYQILYLNMYLQSAVAIPPTAAADASASANANVAMLEVEEQAQPTETKFFSPLTGGAGFLQYTQMLKMYQVLLQMYGAQAALASVNAEKVAFEKLNDSTSSNDKEGIDSQTSAHHLFSSFGQNIAQAAQLEQLVAYFELWSLYAPAFAGAAAPRAE